MYIKSVKNDHETGNNRVHILADTTAETIQYGLFRAFDGDDRFVLVEKEPADQPSNFNMEDQNAQAGQVAYRYQIGAYDACDAIIGWSQVAHSVHLSGTKNIRDLINTLNWTPYEGFDTLGNGVLGYDIYRSAGYEEVLASYDSPVRHQDDIGYLPDLEGDVCYYVAVPEDGENSYGIQDTSISNLLCFEFPALAFVPNAFSPDGDGVNDVFQPHLNFIDRSDYRLIIYDRTGRLVFETDNPDIGWNGEGHHIGTYAFHLTMRNVHGEVIEQAGKIHLIR